MKVIQALYLEFSLTAKEPKVYGLNCFIYLFDLAQRETATELPTTGSLIKGQNSCV